MFIRTKFGLFCPAFVTLKDNTLINRIIKKSTFDFTWVLKSQKINVESDVMTDVHSYRVKLSTKGYKILRWCLASIFKVVVPISYILYLDYVKLYKFINVICLKIYFLFTKFCFHIGRQRNQIQD